MLSGKHNTNKKQNIEYVNWNPPTKGYKLNTNGSYINNTRMGGTGGVFRVTESEWVLGYTSNTLESSNIKAELLALVQGLKLAISRNLMPLEINVDYEDIVLLIFNNIESKYSNILYECRALLQQMGNPPPPPQLDTTIVKLMALWMYLLGKELICIYLTNLLS